MKILFTDFDGTIAQHNKVNKHDFQTLQKLGNLNIIRVLATGRSIFSLMKCVKPDFPIDYLIFSSGAGIMDWKSKKIILKHNLDYQYAYEVSTHFIQNNIDFMIHDTIPNNHIFSYFNSGRNNPDFIRRLNIYKDYSKPISSKIEEKDYSQIIAVFDDFSHSEKLNNLNENVKMIRATSPLDNKSLWLEIFNKKASKGNSALWLCRYLGVSIEDSIGIGNDYNDTDLLDLTSKSFILENSPKELHSKYMVGKKVSENGFSEILKDVFDFNV